MAAMMRRYAGMVRARPEGIEGFELPFNHMHACRGKIDHRIIAWNTSHIVMPRRLQAW